MIAWNDLAAALMEDFSALPRRDRNLIRRVFLRADPRERRWCGLIDADAIARTAARQLRATAARCPSDPKVSALVEELLSARAEFTRLWATHDVRTEPAPCTTINHPMAGPSPSTATSQASPTGTSGS